MFKTAIKPDFTLTGTVCTYFVDLNIIMPLKSAVLYVENGEKYEVFVGEDKLSPVCQKEKYLCYELTEYVSECDFLFVRTKEKENTALRARVDLEFAGGKSETVFTDNNWYWSENGKPEKSALIFENFSNNVLVEE